MNLSVKEAKQHIFYCKCFAVINGKTEIFKVNNLKWNNLSKTIFYQLFLHFTNMRINTNNSNFN